MVVEADAEDSAAVTVAAEVRFIPIIMRIPNVLTLPVFRQAVVEAALAAAVVEADAVDSAAATEVAVVVLEGVVVVRSVDVDEVRRAEGVRRGAARVVSVKVPVL